MNSGTSRIADDDNFRRPGQKINGAVERNQLLGCGDVEISGPTILSTRGMLSFRRPVRRWPARRRPDRIASPQAFRRLPALLLAAAARPREYSPRPPPAPESLSSATVDTTDGARRERSSPPNPAAEPFVRQKSPARLRVHSARLLPFAESADVRRRLLQSTLADRASRLPCCLNLCVGTLQRRSVLQVHPSARHSCRSARSPCRRTSAMMRRTAGSTSSKREPRAGNPAHLRCRGRCLTECALHHHLIQRILHNPLCLGFLQPRDDFPGRDSSITVFTASQSSSLRVEMVGLLQGRQNREHRWQDLLCARSASAPRGLGRPWLHAASGQGSRSCAAFGKSVQADLLAMI